MIVNERALRIAHVVTLFSPDGAYGGPTRVAANQAKGLMERGHEVTLLGGARGFDQLPEMYDGVPARLFPVAHLVPRSGFAGLSSPGLAAYLTRHARDFDVIHVHMARDLVTLPAAFIARRRGVPFVAQTHGMIDASSKLLAKPLDRLLTRPLLNAAERVLYLTPREAADLRSVAGTADLQLEMLPNGVPAAEPLPLTTEEPLDVLFLARLHERKRPRVLLEAADLLAERFPNVTFSIVGPDEGEGAEVRNLAQKLDPNGQRVRVEGALQPHETLGRMRQSSIYVLPSANEPFPMSVLEAMSVGIPVVINDDCGLSDAVRTGDAGVVTAGSATSVAEAISSLLGDEKRRNEMGRNARKLVKDSFSMEAVAERLEEIYRAAVAAMDEVGSPA
jgi:glycosyltransferase involved in cell wall biosynthesis